MHSVMAPSAYKGSEKPRFHYAIRADEWLIRVKIEVAKDVCLPLCSHNKRHYFFPGRHPQVTVEQLN